MQSSPRNSHKNSQWASQENHNLIFEEKQKVQLQLIENQQHMVQKSQDYCRTVRVRSNLFQSFFHVYIAGFKVPISIKYFPYQNLTEHKPKDPGESPMSGGFGTCIFIKEPKNQQAKCLKITYFKDKNQQFQNLQDFIREVGICKIASQNEFGPKTYQILQFDILVYKNCMCFLMEKCEPLLKRLQEIHGDELLKQNQKVIKNLLLCCEKKKQFHIIHRDIKESNTAYCHRLGRYILIDFGISHCVQENENEKSKVKKKGGTPGYVMNNCLLYGSSNNQKVNLYQNDEYAVKIVQKNLKTIQYLQFQKIGFKDVIFQLKQKRLENQQKEILDFVKITQGYTYLTHCLWEEYIDKYCPQEESEAEKQDQEDFKSLFGTRFYSQQLDNIQNIMIEIGRGTDYQIKQEAKFIFDRLQERKLKNKGLITPSEKVQLKCLQFLGGLNNLQISQILSKFSNNNQTEIIPTFQAIIDIQYEERINRNEIRQDQNFGQKQYQNYVKDYPDIENSQLILLFLLDHINKIIEEISRRHLPKHYLLILKNKKSQIFEIHQNLLPKQNPYSDRQINIKPKIKSPPRRYYYDFLNLALHCTIIRKQLKYSFICKQYVMNLISKSYNIYYKLSQQSPEIYNESPYLGLLNFYSGTLYKTDPSKSKQALNSNIFAQSILFKHFGQENYYTLQIYQNLSQIYSIQGNLQYAKQQKRKAYLAVFQAFDLIQILRIRFFKHNLPQNEYIEKFNKKLIKLIINRDERQWAQFLTNLVNIKNFHHETKIPIGSRQIMLKQKAQFYKGCRSFFESSQRYFPYETNSFLQNIAIEKLKPVIQDSDKQKIVLQLKKTVKKIQCTLKELQLVKQKCKMENLQCFYESQRELIQNKKMSEKKKIKQFKKISKLQTKAKDSSEIIEILSKLEQFSLNLAILVSSSQTIKENMEDCFYLKYNKKVDEMNAALKEVKRFLFSVQKLFKKSRNATIELKQRPNSIFELYKIPNLK